MIKVTKTGEQVNVFHLANVRSALSKYYIDLIGNVYSTAGGDGKFVKLAGTPTKNGRRFTLSGSSSYSTGSYTHEQLRKMAEATAGWNGYVNSLKPVAEAPKPAVVLPAGDAKRSHALTLAAGLAAKGWIIASVQPAKGQVEEQLVIGSKPKIHTTTDSVKSEMERLALQYPGTTFVSLRVQNTVKAAGIQWS